MTSAARERVQTHADTHAATMDFFTAIGRRPGPARELINRAIWLAAPVSVEEPDVPQAA